MAKSAMLVVVIGLVSCCRIMGQTIVQGCAQGSCNPTATGGSSTSGVISNQNTDVTVPQQDSGNPFTDILGAVLPAVIPAAEGRKLRALVANTANEQGSPRQLRQQQQPIIVQGCGQGSCNPTAYGGNSQSISQPTQTTPVQPQQQDSGNPITDILGGIFDGRKLRTVDELSIGSATALEGHSSRQLKCSDTAHQAECNAWGPSQCGLPGVSDKCPCMCSVSPNDNGGNGGTTILVQPVAVGCLGNSCNPSAGGGDAVSGGK